MNYKKKIILVSVSTVLALNLFGCNNKDSKKEIGTNIVKNNTKKI